MKEEQQFNIVDVFLPAASLGKTRVSIDGIPIRHLLSIKIEGSLEAMTKVTLEICANITGKIEAPVESISHPDPRPPADPPIDLVDRSGGLL